MLDRKLIDYLPPVLQRVKEFAALTGALQPEIEAAWSAISLVLDNQFIDTATEAGVAIWERELNIAPLASDTLEDRKRRLKTAWAYGVVYTYTWLTNWLSAASASKDYSPPTVEDYTLKIEFPADTDYLYMVPYLRQQIPANILLAPRLVLAKGESSLYIGVALAQAITVTCQCSTAGITGVDYLTDESGNILTDEHGARLIL